MEKVTISSLFDLVSLGRPQVAGSRVFFLQKATRKEENDYPSQILAWNLDSQSLEEWGDQSESQTALALSPDKATLSFLSKEAKEGKMQLALQSLKGGRATFVTHEKEGVSSYFWSQDGQKIYYQTSTKEEKPETKEPQPIVVTKTTYILDGAGFLDTDKTYQAKVLDLATKESQVLYESQTPFSLAHVGSDHLILNRSLSHEDKWQYGRSLPYRVDLDTREEVLLAQVDDSGDYAVVAVSPSGQSYLIVGNDFSLGFVTQNKLFQYDVASASLTNLTQDLDVELGDLLVADFQQASGGIGFEWLDEERFTFSTSEEGAVHAYLGHKSGKLEKVTPGKLHLTGASTLDGQTWYVTYSHPTRPSALASYQVGETELVDIYNPNQEWEGSHSVVPAQELHLKGYEDWPLHGWYLPPQEASDSHPAVLYVHGGPQVAYGWSFFHEMQVLANLGYGVIMLNPRGGNSYGQDYVAAILGDYGNHDFDDLMLGLDQVLDLYPSIDKDNLYVAGGSYGGFMTNWIITHTDRFRAACTQRSISNWLSFYGASDIGPFFVENQLKHDILDPQVLWNMSPLAHISQAKTPTLVLHSLEDYRCPVEQGQQMYIGLKKQGVDTKMVLFPKSSHGLSRNGLPNLRVSRLEHILDWFHSHA